MKKSASLRPVSQKAYARFVERIHLVISDKAKRKTMLATLDSYLDGDRQTYVCNLTPDCVMVFEMLRFEIDLAIARSVKARSRVRRKTAKAEADNNIRSSHHPADNKTIEKPGNNPDSNTKSADDDSIEITPRVSRRIRRAVDRIARTKTKWRKL